MSTFYFILFFCLIFALPCLRLFYFIWISLSVSLCLSLALSLFFLCLILLFRVETFCWSFSKIYFPRGVFPALQQRQQQIGMNSCFIRLLFLVPLFFWSVFFFYLCERFVLFLHIFCRTVCVSNEIRYGEQCAYLWFERGKAFACQSVFFMFKWPENRC